MLNYYQLLNLKTDATPDEIRHAYRTLMRKYHPDLSDLPRDEATQKSAEINEAYRTLIDTKKRQDYDNLLKLRGERVVSYTGESTKPQSPANQQTPRPSQPPSGSPPNGPPPPREPQRTPEYEFNEEEYLRLFADRQKYKQMIDQFYAVHTSRFKPNWNNADMHKYLKRTSQGVSTQLGIETDVLDLFDVEFSGSDWSNLVIERFTFRNSTFKGVNFQGAFIFDCEFTECDFTGSNFTGAYIQNPKKIQKCTFINCKFDKFIFRGQIIMIRQCNFKGASGKGMDFTDLNGKFKQDLKTQIVSCLTEPHWKNTGTEEILKDIEDSKPPKKGIWPFGKR
jgi:curved DNA-binding protein CbpA